MSDLDELQKRIRSLADTVNASKSEAVQLRVVAVLLGLLGILGLAAGVGKSQVRYLGDTYVDVKERAKGVVKLREDDIQFTWDKRTHAVPFNRLAASNTGRRIGSTIAAQTNSPSPPDGFRFAPDQSVYVVAAQGLSRNLELTSSALELERKAREQFRKAKKFKIARTLNEAHFVFFVLIDPDSANFDELALAVLPTDYVRHGANLDALRSAALWQDTAHLKAGRNAALAGATLGVSAIFHRPSVVKGLVKQFHRDAFPKPRSGKARP